MAEWSIASDCKSDALVASVVRIHHPSPEADIAQLVEHVIGNDEVRGSIPRVGSRIKNEKFFNIIHNQSSVGCFGGGLSCPS